MIDFIHSTEKLALYCEPQYKASYSTDRQAKVVFLLTAMQFEQSVSFGLIAEHAYSFVLGKRAVIAVLEYVTEVGPTDASEWATTGETLAVDGRDIAELLNRI